MSTSPPDPENAAPTALWRAEQTYEAAHAADVQNHARRAATRQNLSSSLLSRLFAPSYQVDESSAVAAGSDKSTETVATAGSSCQVGVEGNSLNDINNPDSKSPMATTMPSAELPASDLRQPNLFLTGHQGLLNNRRGRGTSLELTQKEKRAHGFSKSAFSFNLGGTGITNSPPPQSPTATVISPDNSLLDSVRINYRSQRDAHLGMATEKAWSIGEQASGEVPEGPVEKSVAEALAGIEPNNRSRKASHSLRFFKEGLPDEKPKRREPKDSGRLKDNPRRMKDTEPSDISNADEGNDRKSRDIDKPAPSNIETSLRIPDSLSQAGESESPLGNSQPQVDKRLKPASTQSLDNLANEPDLASGPAKGSSYSWSLPMSESEREKPSSNPQEVHEPKVTEAGTRENPSVAKDEDEESGEEQISSALFVPHKTSHDSSGREVLEPGDQEQLGFPSQRSGLAESEEWLVEHKIPPRDDDEISVEKAAPHELLAATGNHTPEQEHDSFFSGVLQSPDLLYDTVSEASYSTKDEESSFTDDAETTPTGRISGGHYMARNHKDHLRRHQQAVKAPLEAIELIPYRHQVGGHTTMWRFSRRAVCKQLNNRENEFYERIERYHPKLLKFMPRYIGVLNVTFEKQQRRRVSTKENGIMVEGDAVSPGLSEHSLGSTFNNATDLPKPNTGDDRCGDSPRLVSQSISSGQGSTPTVTFADNRHIIPKSFLQPSLQTQEAIRRYLNEGTAVTALSARRPSQSQLLPSNGDIKFRSALSEKHAISWGATTVNKKLRNEVFGEAFLQQPIPIQRHTRPARQYPPLAHRPGFPESTTDKQL